METILARHAGFCKGVKDAVAAAMKAADQAGGSKICTLGPLVHNPQVTEKLAEAGVPSFDGVEEIPRGWTVILRTHGAAPQVLAALKKNQNPVIDLTCPIVRRVQQVAAEEARQGRQVLIVGDGDHPEVLGIKGWAGEGARVVGRVEDLPEDLQENVVIVVQTTYIPREFAEITKKIQEKYPCARVYDTICKSTVLRQEEAVNLARQVDAMLVIGGSSSSNTRKLTELCRDIGTKTYQIASPAEVDSLGGWAEIGKVGVTAGASTPDWTIKEVIGKMENKEPEVVQQEGEEARQESQEVVQQEGEEARQESQEAVQPEGEEARQEGQEAVQPEEEAFQGEMKDFDVGDKVSGKVVQVNAEEVLVDIGYKSEGILPLSEIHLMPGESLEDTIKTGDVVEVLVKKIDDEEGKVILSKKSLDKKLIWHQLEKALADKATMTGKVKEAVQAGIIVDLGAGLEGFMPGSLVDTRYIPDFKEFLGKDVEFKVIEINPEKLKVILSRKLVLEEAVESKKKETLERIKEGDVITGEVRRLTDFGAFVDVGGIDGLVHISEIAWKRIDHPRDVLKVGEEVQIKVLEVIPERERIGLSLRQAQPDPWSVLEEKFKPGTIVDGKVTRLVNFGAFVELLPGVEGLAHISQLADYHVKHPQEVLQEGQDIKVKILDINMGAKRISLSVKEAQGRGRMESAMSDPDGGSGVTLGDVFGDLFDQEDKES